MRQRLSTFSLLSLSLLLGIGTGVRGQFEAESRIRCNAAYCEDNQIQCESPRNCTGTVGRRTFLSPGVCNCCEYCYNYRKAGENCQTVNTNLPDSMCGPQLQCYRNADGDQNCIPMDSTNTKRCISAVNAYRKRSEEGKDGVADFEPECDAHGDYVPRQCLPGSSICICMNSDGNPIFGAGLLRNPMDCACARDVDRLKSYKLTGTFPHCLPNGDYDQLQCSLQKRTCSCRVKPGEAVSIRDMEDLPCYKKELHPPTYIRWCEVDRSAYRILRVDAAVENRTILIGDEPACDPDGHYGLVQSKEQNWQCVDPNGEQIEDFSVPKLSGEPTPPVGMNCLCARMRYLMGETATGKPKCCKNGNYRPWQCVGSTCYCVDSIGRQDMSLSPPEVNQDEAESLTCYETC